MFISFQTINNLLELFESNKIEVTINAIFESDFTSKLKDIQVYLCLTMY